MKTIHHAATLFYYDGHQVFEARDAIGGHYVCVLVKTTESGSEYGVVGVSPERLRDFRVGNMDLRSLMTATPLGAWYRATMTAGLEEPLALVPQKTPLMESGILPEPEFMLHDRPADDAVVREARERNNLVIALSTEPPESVTKPGIRIETLIGVLMHLQGLVRHAHRAATRALSPSAPFHDRHLLNVVVPANPGSFRVLLEAADLPNLFGHRLSPALREVDALFGQVGNPEKTIEVVRDRRGHFAGSYVKLLKFLRQHDTGLRYSWAEPDSEKSATHGVSPAEATSLVDTLSLTTSLTSEERVLEGEFQKFHRGTGTWGLLTSDGVLNGRMRDNDTSLDGLVVGGSYRFYCDEEITSIDTDGRETHTLFLKQYEEM